MKRILAFALAAALLAGCASGPKPTSLEMNIDAGAQLNPSMQKRPSPVVVRLFELKTPAAFEAADFVSLFEREREVLAADLVARDEFVIRPGEKRQLERMLQNDTRLLGIAVAFRDLERATWRTSVAVKSGTKNRISLALDGIVVTAAPAPAK